MKVCAACGEENAERMKFCGECGSPLTAAAPRQEERKIVTVLFADLVGFTSRSERMDVEDVRGTLEPYHRLLRRELERHGGTVEKFIGDAVMALFGAPTAHEDDPERAVRAALAIQEAVGELRERDERLDLHVRIGVNTGEALVALGANPNAGEGMASGDVVNTAARLQAAAPVDGVLVGEVTYRGTARVCAYEPAAPIAAKGKADPVPAYVACGIRSRLGGEAFEAHTSLVGRERQLSLLWAAFEQAREERSAQLVTLIGVPGIGKSRLVHEVLRKVEADTELITWRQGRSLPYGDGVALWALSEMVKAEVGALENDSAQVREQKLHGAVSGVLQEAAEAAWVERELRPLVGLETGNEVETERRQEAFAAWRKFLEALCDRRPTVLCFEDLHWADDVLLDFIDYLVEWASGVPLLCVCTTRPELLERRGGWGGGKPNALTIALAPLSTVETAMLIASLLEQAVLPADLQSALLERAEGNPLFAEEYVRMLQDRGILEHDGRAWRLRPGAQVPLPESVSGIIAARVDALSPEEKSVLRAAAVVGKVFWEGALGLLIGAPQAATADVLHRLSRKDFLARQRTSSVSGEAEYAFRHILVRDVAYGQIPRSERARLHEQAADWIEGLSADREDRAEMVAHHLAEALALSLAAGVDRSDLTEKTRAALVRAGDHLRRLKAFAAAAHRYEQAISLLVPGEEDLVLRLQALLMREFAYDDGEALGGIVEPLLQAGERELAAEAACRYGVWLGNRGDQPGAIRGAGHAIEIVRDLPSTPLKVRALRSLGFALATYGRPRDGLPYSLEALAVAEQSGFAEEVAACVMSTGIARVIADDPQGLADIERAARLTAGEFSESATTISSNAAELMRLTGSLARLGEAIQQAQSKAEALGLLRFVRASSLQEAERSYWAGDWDRSETLADALIEELEGGWRSLDAPRVWALRGLIRAARAAPAGALSDASRALEAARAVGDQSAVIPGLAFAAHTFLRAGRQTEARELAEEALSMVEHDMFEAGPALFELIDVLDAAQRRRFLEAANRTNIKTPWLLAAAAICQTHLTEAVAIYQRTGALPETAAARQLLARQLLEQGRTDAATRELNQSLAVWRDLSAHARIAEVEALLAGERTA